MKHLALDGDSALVYRAAFTVQPYNKDILLPVDIAYEAVDSIIRSVCEATGINDYSIYLGISEDNFRNHIQGNKHYKANRDKNKRPFYYDAVREYLIDNHKAELVKGQEVDDTLGILLTQYPNEIVISGNDKDLYQIPGNLFDTYHTRLFYNSDPGSLELRNSGSKKICRGSGFKWFCAQMLIGDKEDNVEGISDIGHVGAFKALNDINSPLSLWEKVSKLYQENNKSDEQLWGTARLLWIRRKPEQMFSIETVEEIQENFI